VRGWSKAKTACGQWLQGTGRGTLHSNVDDDDDDFSLALCICIGNYDVKVCVCVYVSVCDVCLLSLCHGVDLLAIFFSYIFFIEFFLAYLLRSRSHSHSQSAREGRG